MKISYFSLLDRFLISEMHSWGIPVLRWALGIIFLWFGALKVLGVSPVVDLITATYFFLPPAFFIPVLGIWEVAIGLGLISKFFLRGTLALLWLQLIGAFAALVLAPALFFTNDNIFLLTMEGEFVIKNLILVAAGLVIGGYEVKRNLYD